MRMTDKLKVAGIVMALSCIAKVALEFLRESHAGKIISGYQILVITITVVFVVVFYFMSGRLKANKS